MLSIIDKFLSVSADIFLHTPRYVTRSFNDHAGRGLTSGELEMARSIFGETLDYSRIRVSDSINSRSEFGSVIRNHVFLHPVLADTDDLSSSNNIFNKALFIHELAHVWQNQNNIGNTFTRMATGFRSKVLGQDVYAYDLSKDFARFNHEQQAMLLEDLFTAREAKRLHGPCTKINGIAVDVYIEDRRKKAEANFPDL